MASSVQTAELEARWAVRGQASREVWANPHALGLGFSLSVVIYPFTCPLLLRDDTSQAQTGEPPSLCGPREAHSLRRTEQEISVCVTTEGQVRGWG